MTVSALEAEKMTMMQYRYDICGILDDEVDSIAQYAADDPSIVAEAIERAARCRQQASQIIAELGRYSLRSSVGDEACRMMETMIETLDNLAHIPTN